LRSEVGNRAGRLVQATARVPVKATRLPPITWPSGADRLRHKPVARQDDPNHQGLMASVAELRQPMSLEPLKRWARKIRRWSPGMHAGQVLNDQKRGMGHAISE